MMFAFLVLIVNLTLPGISSQGDRIFYDDARSMALGGVSIVLENTGNPASMGLYERSTVALSGIAAIQNERRGLRVYDSFGNNIGIATIANNTSTYLNPGPCSFVFPLKGLRVGLRYAPVWDLNYFYREEHRDDFYQLVRTDELSYEGYLQAVSPLLSFTYRFISVGIEHGFLFGEERMERIVIIPDLPDSVERDETDYSGNKTKVGVSIVPSVNLRIAYTYGLEYEFADQDIRYPATHSVGVMYQPPGRIPTKFVGQLDLETWQDEYIYVYRLGVEHSILMKYNLRYGFCIFPDYTQGAIWTTNLTLGFGIKTGMYSFDVGYLYGKRDYLASDFTTLNFTENYKFDETSHHISVTTRIQF
ncbi:MAG: hypothetical protein JSU64_01435 [candidate division WOR-3 bacterium]|nr:MAG: hypothetical protein JSU64_01435 [candidate division WOR-3 bacterium]